MLPCVALSHPSRVRELKRLSVDTSLGVRESHPSRVRELKHGEFRTGKEFSRRTPPGCVN